MPRNHGKGKGPRGRGRGRGPSHQNLQPSSPQVPSAPPKPPCRLYSPCIRLQHEFGDMPKFTPVIATVRDLIPSTALHKMAEDTKFIITYFYKTEYDRLDIMVAERKLDELFHLQEDIMEAIESDMQLQRSPPQEKEILLAPKLDPSGKVTYHRAAVLQVHEDQERVLVYFFDVGGWGNIAFKYLRPVNLSVMKYPVLGYHVFLDNVPEVTYQFTVTRYQTLMEEMKKTEFCLEVSDVMESAGYFTSKRKVIMTYTKPGSSTFVSLNDTINDLKEWEWETFSKGKGTDDEICEKGSFGTQSRAESQDPILMHYPLQKDARFSAEVARIICDRSDPSTCSLNLILLDDPVYQNYFNVIHRQLERYSKCITMSRFWPAMNEPVMFMLEDDPAFAGKIKFIGRWARGIRMDQMIYLLDFDDYVPFMQLAESKYQIRRLYPEFFKIPVLTVRVRPMENGTPLPLSKAQDLFKPGLRYTFRALGPYCEGTFDVNFERKICKPRKTRAVAEGGQASSSGAGAGAAEGRQASSSGAVAAEVRQASSNGAVVGVGRGRGRIVPARATAGPSRPSFDLASAVPSRGAIGGTGTGAIGGEGGWAIRLSDEMVAYYRTRPIGAPNIGDYAGIGKKRGEPDTRGNLSECRTYTRYTCNLSPDGDLRNCPLVTGVRVAQYCDDYDSEDDDSDEVSEDEDRAELPDGEEEEVEGASGEADKESSEQVAGTSDALSNLSLKN